MVGVLLLFLVCSYGSYGGQQGGQVRHEHSVCWLPTGLPCLDHVSNFVVFDRVMAKEMAAALLEDRIMVAMGNKVRTKPHLDTFDTNLEHFPPP